LRISRRNFLRFEKLYACIDQCSCAGSLRRHMPAANSNVEQETEPIELGSAATVLGLLIIIAIIAGGLLPQNFLRLARDGLASTMP